MLRQRLRVLREPEQESERVVKGNAGIDRADNARREIVRGAVKGWARKTNSVSCERPGIDRCEGPAPLAFLGGRPVLQPRQPERGVGADSVRVAARAAHYSRHPAQRTPRTKRLANSSQVTEPMVHLLCHLRVADRKFQLERAGRECWAVKAQIHSWCCAKGRRRGRPLLPQQRPGGATRTGAPAGAAPPSVRPELRMP